MQLELTNLTAKGVLSPSGKCSSRASTKQLAMIVISTMYSNGLSCSQGNNVHTDTRKRLTVFCIYTWSYSSFQLFLRFLNLSTDFTLQTKLNKTSNIRHDIQRVGSFFSNCALGRSWYINVMDRRTDRQTDERTTYDNNTALCTACIVR